MNRGFHTTPYRRISRPEQHYYSVPSMGNLWGRGVVDRNGQDSIPLSVQQQCSADDNTDMGSVVTWARALGRLLGWGVGGKGGRTGSM